MSANGIILCTCLFVFFLILAIMSSVPSLETRIANYENTCKQRWSSFETRVVQIETYNGIELVCQVYHKGQWLPTQNVTFNLNEE